MPDSTAPSLGQLPPEVLHVVFYYLDIPDILRLRRVSRYLDGISHDRQVWTNAYRTAEFIRPPGPCLWQSVCNLETALVCGFRVDRNLRNSSGLARTEKPALKRREFRCKNWCNGVHLAFGRFLLIGFEDEVCCYDLNVEVLDSNRDPSIIYRSPGQQLAGFHCVSSFDVEGRPFECAVLVDVQGPTPQFSIYSLHVEEQSGVTLDLLHQFVSSTTLIDSINLGPRAIVFQNEEGRRLVVMDVHTRTEFLIPSIHVLMEAAGMTEFAAAPMRHSPTTISTSTHVVMGKSYFDGVGWKTFFQVFPLPPSNFQCSSTPLSPSHRGVISDIEVFNNALLHDTIVDSSTNDVLIAIRVITGFSGHSKSEHGILRLNTDGTLTFRLLGAWGQLSHSPAHRPSGSLHGSGRTFVLGPGDHGLSALYYDLRPGGDDEKEIKVVEYPRIVHCSPRHSLLDYDPYSGRLCLARHTQTPSPPVIEIVDLAI